MSKEWESPWSDLENDTCDFPDAGKEENDKVILINKHTIASFAGE